MRVTSGWRSMRNLLEPTPPRMGLKSRLRLDDDICGRDRLLHPECNEYDNCDNCCGDCMNDHYLHNHTMFLKTKNITYLITVFAACEIVRFDRSSSSLYEYLRIRWCLFAFVHSVKILVYVDLLYVCFAFHFIFFLFSILFVQKILDAYGARARARCPGSIKLNWGYVFDENPMYFVWYRDFLCPREPDAWQST